MRRTHTCGELDEAEITKEVTLDGWVATNRDHGGVIFIDLRDRYGITQLVVNPEDKELFKAAEELRKEDVVEIKGVVRERPEGMTNPAIKTGKIEVAVKNIEVLNKTEVPPIEVDDKKEAGEEQRMRYRYLDLRRPIMQQKFIFRHKATQATRSYLNSQGFLELETPLLVRATPEGARDYIVPSRPNPGLFYALPQSPQLYKQLLMVAGFDRYYQLPRCLRDEDLRSDRQPEFTQIDIEMSFPTEEGIFKIGEELCNHIFKETLGQEIKLPIPRIKYAESMARYGCDKPDLRFKLELTDVTSIVVKSSFGVFKEVEGNGGIIKCINPEKELPRKEIDKYIEFCQKNGAKGMAWMRVTPDGLDSNIAKFFPEDVQKELIERTGAKSGSILMFIADKEKKANDVLARLRNKLGEDLELYDKNTFEFCWIVDFPLFEFNEEENKWEAAHHMFTMPKEECIKYIEDEPEKVIATCYDLVLNGVELASGSIRVHRSDIQERIMNRVGFSKELAKKRFGFLLEAFTYGAPPHGGFAIGFDRLVAMMQGQTDIREVILFPKNKNAQCLMDGSPSEVDPIQLKENNIKVDIVKKKE